MRADIPSWTGPHTKCGRTAVLRTPRHVLALLLVAFFVLSNALMTFPFAQIAVAHGDEGTEHAEEDLAGTSISEIETKTAENKARITKETKTEPGSAKAARLDASSQAALAAVSADPGVSGRWSSVYGTPLVPVFQAVLPNGKVLMWDSVGDNATESYPNQTFTRAMVWNPVDNTFKRVDVVGYNIFCAGFAHLQNGNILVAGGNKDQSLAGIVQTHVFNWQTETWTRGANMAAGRWYPSVTQTANGELAIIGGGPAIGEVYQTNGGIRTLPGFNNATYGGRLYPFMISRPDVLLGLFGPYTSMYSLSTSGVGAVTGTAVRDTITRDYGSFATFGIGKTLVVGGGNITEDGIAKVPTKTAVVIRNYGLIPTATPTNPMAIGRRQHNATVLADGSVLVTGGMSSTAANGNVDLAKGVTAAERWDSVTGTWTTLASASRIREYHSTATLLPDGRVLTGGGGICGECVAAGYLEKNIEYFTPPYLYKKDGSGQLAARPVISTASTTVSINTSFTLTSAQASSVRKVGLVGLSDTTHSVNQGQRYVPLTFTTSGTTITATGPESSGVAPPGYYMLFVTDANGVPSVAKIVQVAKGANPLLSGVKSAAAATCVDVPNSSLADTTYLWAFGCNGTNAQALTRFPKDKTLRVLGKCIDVPNSNFVSGQRIWIFGCNGTSAQTWNFGTDGTIRPAANAALCMTAASTTNGAAISVNTCSASTLQKWTW